MMPRTHYTFVDFATFAYFGIYISFHPHKEYSLFCLYSSFAVICCLFHPRFHASRLETCRSYGYRFREHQGSAWVSISHIFTGWMAALIPLLLLHFTSYPQRPLLSIDFSWPRVAGLSLKLVSNDVLEKMEGKVKDCQSLASSSLVSLSTRLISFVTAFVSEGQKWRSVYRRMSSLWLSLY
jgi:hypothetical protein